MALSAVIFITFLIGFKIGLVKSIRTTRKIKQQYYVSRTIYVKMQITEDINCVA